MSEQVYLKIAERMALRAVGSTYPNPPVGAVIVKDGAVLSRGWTQPNGQAHAEIHAINQIKNKKILNGATLYCTLEPCSHRGKNPPCVKKIIKLKFSKVVISEIDRNPLVNGNSVKKLRSAGINVILKRFSLKIRELNKVFFKTIGCNTPFITLKVASTVDGKIATKNYESKWITNHPSRLMGHKLRSLNDCMLVGKKTIEKDNPSLDCRIDGLGNRSPDIFILDNKLKLNKRLKIFKVSKRKIFIFHSCSNAKNVIKSKNINYIYLKEINKLLDINLVLKTISKLGYMRILIEGGSKLTSSLLKEDLIDVIYWFRASKIMGDDGINAISTIGVKELKNMKKFKLKSTKKYFDDEMSIYEKG